MPHESLSLDRQQMQRLGYRVVDMLIEHFEDLPGKPIGRKASRYELEGRLRESLPHEGGDPEAIFETMQNVVLHNILQVNHPRFFAFIPSPGNFVSVLADALASGFNVFAGTWLEGSGPAQVELVVLDWLRELCGLPDTAGGLFVSGGSVANLTALALARDVKLQGRSERGVVYCSDQMHASNERALRILGLQREQLHKLPSDEGFRLPLPDLERSIDSDRIEGKVPFCVVASAGATNTGAVDPLPDLAALCKRENLWLHVDGAYGAAAVLARRGREQLRGLELADSLTLDPHKWLFQPYEIGCLLVRDRRLLRDNFHMLPEYLVDVDPAREEVNFYDYGIQLTRSFRALKLWLSFKIFGLDSFSKAVDRGFELAEEAERSIWKSALLSVVTPPQMGIVTFRFVLPEGMDGDLEDINQRIVAEMIADGFAMVSTTTLRGRTVLRMCTINPRTTTSDIRETVDKIEAAGRRLAGLTNGR
jgi:glutamate/tyrosine decarboxylase-like PLP-dependent enzyme